MIALIDGDVVAYVASSGSTSIEDAIKKYHKSITQIVESCFTEDYMIAIKGQGNYRNDIYPDYKANRKPADPNKFNAHSHYVSDLRAHMIKTGVAVPADNREADDLIRIWAEECKAVGKDYIICSIDKDLKCIPGKHYNIKKNTITEVSEDEADSFYWQQVLQGDPTDNIPGLPKIGPVNALKILAGCTTSEERKVAVINKYKEVYGSDWHDYLLSNGKLTHIQRHKDDYFQINKAKYL